MNNFWFTVGIFFLNLPFGYWRYRTKKYSFSWIFAIHIPVLIILSGRFLFHMPYQIFGLPFNIAAFFLGQYLGGRLRTW